MRTLRTLTTSMGLAAIVLFLGQIAAQAETPDADEIIRKANEMRKLDGSESIATLTIINAKGQTRIRKIATVSKLYPDGTEKRLIRFLEPADVKGTGLLTFDYETKDDDIWFFLPALRKTRRIVASEKAKSFMGSEFSYADLTPPPIADFDRVLLGEEDRGGVLCWKIEETPKTEDIAEENGYSKRILWVGKEDYTVRGAVYYDLDGDVWKELFVREVQLVDPEKKRYRPTYMVMVNKQNDRSSEMRFEVIQVRRDVPDEYFTTRYLERF